MQPVVPYQLRRKLGVCQIGSIWSAVDDQERPLAVAVLDAGIAGEPRWRDAFAATTNAIAHAETAGRLYLAADFSADTPWVAYPGELLQAAERTFVALGMTYQPVPADPADDPDGPGPRDQPGAPEQHGRPSPHAQPSPHEQQRRPNAPAQPHSEPPRAPAPTAPAPPAPRTQPTFPAQPPAGWAPLPVQTPTPSPAGTPPHPARPTPSTSAPAPTGPGAGRWALLAVGLVLGLVAGGGLVTLLDPGAGPSGPPPTAGPSSLPAPASAAAPLSPGLEPPAKGEWPQWVRFTATDRILTLTELDGVSFPVKVPPTWRCTSVERAAGLSRHQCGVPAGGGTALGGELVVRQCPAPCDGPRQTAMRLGEEAWGLQWVRSGPSSAYAESSSLSIDGERRYGLVVVAYWRSGDGDVDQQLVLRMTAPLAGANQLRRVANYLRDVLVF
ncbi:hypothetical protein [Micromonospora sp. DT233]|uniref:hypothetical protein n=1 Tax=Micromonospora sp. DT233 TaxID=3393432 RepID=UPI003CF958A5